MRAPFAFSVPEGIKGGASLNMTSFGNIALIMISHETFKRSCKVKYPIVIICKPLHYITKTDITGYRVTICTIGPLFNSTD